MFLDIMKKRRSYYNITAKASISDDEIITLVQQAALNTPSAYNIPAARTILLLGEHHKIHWNIVEQALRKIVPPENFEPTKGRIDSFAAGYGTVLYFNDEAVISGLQKDMPDFAESFPAFAQHAAGMLQFVIWNLLEEAGMGASLQHYGNLVNDEVAEQWDLPKSYSLIAQMPFGVPNSNPGEKKFANVEDLMRVFK